MRIMVGIGHPKQVHFWKNIINNLEGNGHEVEIVAWEKDITPYLLNAYGFKYKLIEKNYKGLIRKSFGMFLSEIKLLRIARNFKPDLLLAGAPYLAHVSRLIGKTHISFTDTEHANLANSLTYPFTDYVITPSCFKERIDPKKQIKYNGYMELAYLHPNYFKPDPSVLDDLGLAKDDRYIIMRLISWDASHDTKSRGFSPDFLEEAIKSLEQFGHVFITSEKKLIGKLEKYKIRIPAEKLHSALFYSSLYIGEGSTTAVEAALLGTPAVHLEALKNKSDIIISAAEKLGYLDELSNNYKLFYTFTDQIQALNKCFEILLNNNAKRELLEKREMVINDKIDVTKFITDFIEKMQTKI